jgi:hypothetical protein
MTCSTCLYYRRAIVSGMGFCGLDRSRSPLSGEEVRTCWQASDEVAALVPDLAVRGVVPGDADERPPLPVAPAGPAVRPRPEADPNAPPPRSLARRPAPDRSMPSTGTGRPIAADRLIDAPSIPPGRRVASEAARRARRMLEGEASGDRDLPRLGHHDAAAG